MIRGIFSVLIILFSANLAAAQVGTPIPAGSTVTVDVHGECRQVTNPSSGMRMVFTGTAAEWTSFRDNPNGLTMAACSSCNGTVVGSFNWYPGAAGLSCTQVCSTCGGVDMAGTRDYAGSGGTLANCSAVLNALWPGQLTGQVVNQGTGAGSYDSMGCVHWGAGQGVSYGVRYYLVATSADNSAGDTYRACACNN